jgi:hypothetical protein
MMKIKKLIKIMENAESKFEKKLTTLDLPPEVGEYIKVLEGKLDETRPRREELVDKGLDKLTNQEIDELTKLNNEAARVLELIRKSRDAKMIIEDKEEIIDLEAQYNATLEHLKKELGFAPEKEIQTYDVEIGGKTVDQLENEIIQSGMEISEEAKSILHGPDFKISPIKEEIKLIRLKVADLGFKGNPTTYHIYTRAQGLGLDLCPAEVGPILRVQYTGQQINDWLRIAMKQINYFADYPGVFSLGRIDDGIWLGLSRAKLVDKWRPDEEFIFRLRPHHE